MSDDEALSLSELFRKLLVEIETGGITREEAVETLVRNGANGLDARELIFPPWRRFEFQTAEIRILIRGEAVASMKSSEYKWHGESGEWSHLTPDTHPQYADPLSNFARELREAGFEVQEIPGGQLRDSGVVY